MKKDLISIVVPVYGDRKNVKLLYDELIANLSQLDVNYEIIMINDCCPCDSGEEIEKIALTDSHLKFIDLSRNFGQHYAIKAGLDYAQGDYAIVMDCDLQDKPSDIYNFYKKIKEGHDVVFGVRRKRKDGYIKKFISAFYRLVERHLSENCSELNHGNFSIISKKVIDKFKNIQNYNFNYVTIINFLGFKHAYIEIEKEERANGSSGYNLIKGINLALKSLISNSNKPLIFAVYSSFLMFLISFIFIAKLFYDYFALGNKILGWTSLMTALFFIGGLLFAYLGILGLYIGGIFKEVKKRPLYVIKRTINLEENKNGK